MNDFKYDWDKNIRELSVDYESVQKMMLSECAFADGLIIRTENNRKMQRNLNVWKKVLNRFNIKINGSNAGGETKSATRHQNA